MSEQRDLGTIYLSGPMSGLPEENYPEFRKVARQLYEKGYEVINPADLNHSDKKWEACLRVDIAELMKADTVALLKGWQESRGAILEIAVAKFLGMQFVDAYTLEPIELDVSIDIEEKVIS